MAHLNPNLPRPLVAVVAVVVTAAVAVLLFIGWNAGFTFGARQATAQILAQQTQTSELIELRAELSERQRAEDRIASTLLAAFAAVVTVLVIVNIGVVITAQQNYQRDKEAIENILVKQAAALDTDMASDWLKRLDDTRNIIGTRLTEIESKLTQRADAMENGVAEVRKLASIALSMAYMVDAQEKERVGDEWAERSPAFAAYTYATAAPIHARDNRAYSSRLLVGKIIKALNAIAPDEYVSVPLLQQTESHLQEVAAILGPQDEGNSNLHRALALVDALRAKNANTNPPTRPPQTSPE